MKQNVHAFIDPEKGILGAAVAVFMSIMLAAFCFLQMVSGIVVSAILAAVFSAISIRNLSRILISVDRIKVRPLFGKSREYLWEDIKEVGVIGTRIFPKTTAQGSGRKYIYFSPESLNEDTRFNLALGWPPKIPYTSHSTEKLDAIALIWKKPIAYYNVPDLSFKPNSTD